MNQLPDMPLVPPALHRLLVYYCEYVVAHRLLGAQLWPDGLSARTISECVQLQEDARAFSSSATTALLLFDVFSAFSDTGTQADLQSLLLRGKPLAELARLRCEAKQPDHNEKAKELADATVRLAATCPRWDKHVRPCIEAQYHEKHAQRQNRSYFFHLNDNLASGPSRAFVLLQYWLPECTRPHMLLVQSAGGVYHLHDWLMEVAAIEGARATGAVHTYTIPMSATTTQLLRKGHAPIATIATCSADMNVRRAAYRKLRDALRRPLLARADDPQNDAEFNVLLDMIELVCTSQTWTHATIEAHKLLFGLDPTAEPEFQVDGARGWTHGDVHVPLGVIFDTSVWTDASVAQQLARLERTLFAQVNLENATRFLASTDSTVNQEPLVSEMRHVCMLASPSAQA
jgi:hypothetical protein